MGTHSSQQDSPRSGIGNVNQEIINQLEGGKPIPGISKHPGELANILCPPGSTDPRCPPS